MIGKSMFVSGIIISIKGIRLFASFDCRHSVTDTPRQLTSPLLGKSAALITGDTGEREKVGKAAALTAITNSRPHSHNALLTLWLGLSNLRGCESVQWQPDTR